MVGPFDYFHGIPKLLKESGNEVFCANLTAWNTIAHRSHQLKSQIEKEMPGNKRPMGVDWAGTDVEEEDERDNVPDGTDYKAIKKAQKSAMSFHDVDIAWSE